MNHRDPRLTIASWLREFSPTLLAIVLAGVVLRVLWIAMVDVEPVSDTKVYLTRAQSIAMGKGYSYPDGSPTAYWPVGYNAFLALILYLFGGAVVFGKIANIGLFIASCVLVVAIGKQTTLDFGGKAVVAYLALSPNQIAYSNLFASEPLALFLLFGFVFAYTAFHKQRAGFSWGYAIASALLLAAAYYVKPQVLFLPLVASLAILAFRPRLLPRNLSANAFVYAVIVVAVAPWVARNYRQFGQFIPISTNGGINLYIGNNPYATGRYRWDDSVTKPLEGYSEYERDKVAARLAKEYIKSNPLETMKLVPVKLWFLLRTDSEGIAWNEGGLPGYDPSKRSPLFGLKVVSQGFYMTFWVLSLMGAIAVLRRGKRSEPWVFVPALVAVYVVAIHAAFIGTPRYHYLALPFLFLYSGEAIQAYWPRLKRLVA